MKRLLGMLLVLGMLAGCGSKHGATPASTSAKTPTAPAVNKKISSPASTSAKPPDVAEVKKHMTPDQLALGDPFTNSVGMVLVPIPAGEFMMGDKTQQTQHKVKITKPFHLGAFEVTQGQYEKVMGKNPSSFKGAKNLPVEMVNAVEFCCKLSAVPEEKGAGREYRLPTEAEWEYACRAGTTTAYSFGDDASQLGQYGWYDDNSEDRTHPVGLKKPNAWGLHDMHGNVWEWCQDWYANYPSGSVTDPQGPQSGLARVLRGGCWLDSARSCESSDRIGLIPAGRNFNLGFRVAQVPSSQPSKKQESSRSK